MSKIEDIAREYVEERRDLDVGHANCQFNCFHMEDAVKFGANAVLSEIEDILSFPRIENGDMKVMRIEGLIRELKGGDK